MLYSDVVTPRIRYVAVLYFVVVVVVVVADDDDDDDDDDVAAAVLIHSVRKGLKAFRWVSATLS